MSRVSYVGQNVVREHNGDWWYVVGPGLDEPLLAVKRGFSGMANATQLWLPVVSDDRGQLIAIADSGGQLQGPLIGPQYDAGLWNSSGLTSHAQSFNPRRWATPGGIDTIQRKPPLFARSLLALPVKLPLEVRRPPSIE